jgi:hypothetical protein
MQSIELHFEQCRFTDTADDDDDNAERKGLARTLQGSIAGVEVENISRARQCLGRRNLVANDLKVQQHAKEVFRKFEETHDRSPPYTKLIKKQLGITQREPGMRYSLSGPNPERSGTKPVNPPPFSMWYWCQTRHRLRLHLLDSWCRQMLPEGMDSNGTDQVLPAKEGRDLFRLHDNLKLFSAEAREEQMSCGSLFRERIGQFAGQTRTELETTTAASNSVSFLNPEPTSQK